MSGRRFARGGDAAPGAARSKGLVDRLQDRRRGAEGKVERHGLEAPFGFAMTFLEVPLHLGEFFRLRPLEGEDRLLLVADREHGSLLAPPAFAGKKLRAQRG